MLIAISQKHEKNKYGEYIDVLENNYVKYLESFGILLLPIPNAVEKIEDYFEKFPIQGIILTGGNDINPNLYDGFIDGKSISIDRDSTERKLIDIAIKRKLPLLGICRGCQFINIYFGGKLINIEEELNQNLDQINSTHEVEIINDGLKKIIGNKIKVNSYHNQGITKQTISNNFEIFAKSSDGIIEGIYHKKVPIAGIIWHPERASPDTNVNKVIIESFVKGELFWKK